MIRLPLACVIWEQPDGYVTITKVAMGGAGMRKTPPSPEVVAEKLFRWLRLKEIR